MKGASQIEQFVFVVKTARFNASLAFYRDGLGLSVMEEWTDFGHGAVLSAEGHARVELIEAEVGEVPAPRDRDVFLGLQVRDVDSLYQRLLDAGFETASAPAPRAWGGRGFAAFDPNGVAVNIYSAYDTADASSQ